MPQGAQSFINNQMKNLSVSKSCGSANLCRQLICLIFVSVRSREKPSAHGDILIYWRLLCQEKLQIRISVKNQKNS